MSLRHPRIGQRIIVIDNHTDYHGIHGNNNRCSTVFIGVKIIITRNPTESTDIESVFIDVKIKNSIDYNNVVI